MSKVVDALYVKANQVSVPPELKVKGKEGGNDVNMGDEEA